MSTRGKLYQGGTTLAREAMLTRAENGEFAATVASEGKTYFLGRIRLLKRSERWRTQG